MFTKHEIKAKILKSVIRIVEYILAPPPLSAPFISKGGGGKKRQIKKMRKKMGKKFKRVSWPQNLQNWEVLWDIIFLAILNKNIMWGRKLFLKDSSNSFHVQWYPENSGFDVVSSCSRFLIFSVLKISFTLLVCWRAPISVLLTISPLPPTDTSLVDIF